MTDPKEEIALAGPPDPELFTSPIARVGDTHADYNCWYNGKQFSNGSLICMVGELFQCSYGVWIDKNKSCHPPK